MESEIFFVLFFISGAFCGAAFMGVYAYALYNYYEERLLSIKNILISTYAQIDDLKESKEINSVGAMLIINKLKKIFPNEV